MGNRSSNSDEEQQWQQEEPSTPQSVQLRVHLRNINKRETSTSGVAEFQRAVAEALGHAVQVQWVDDDGASLRVWRSRRGKRFDPPAVEAELAAVGVLQEGAEAESHAPQDWTQSHRDVYLAIAMRRQGPWPTAVRGVPVIAWETDKPQDFKVNVQGLVIQMQRLAHEQ